MQSLFSIQKNSSALGRSSGKRSASIAGLDTSSEYSDDASYNDEVARKTKRTRTDKMRHNEVERRRKQGIKTELNALNDLLPGKNPKHTQWCILHGAVEYIKDLKRQLEALEEENADLLKIEDKLINNLNSMKPKNASGDEDNSEYEERISLATSTVNKKEATTSCQYEITPVGHLQSAQLVTNYSFGYTPSPPQSNEGYYYSSFCQNQSDYFDLLYSGYQKQECLLPPQIVDYLGF